MADDKKRFSEDFEHWIQTIATGTRLMIEDPVTGVEYWVTREQILSGINQQLNDSIADEVTARNLAITTAIDNLKNGVPQAFDTLIEIYNELQNDDSVIAGLINTIAGKVDRTTLISITGTTVSTVAGQKAYDPITKKIYTSTVNHTWGIGANPSTGIIYTYNGSNYVWKQTDLIEIGTGGTGGGTDTGMLTVEANSLSDFDDIFAVGAYEIVGDNISGFYIGSFIFPKLKQMVIWDNKIYTREMDDITGTFTCPDFVDYNNPELLNGKVDKVALIAITDNMDQPRFHNIGDKWYDLMTKKIFTVIWSTTINDTHIWDAGVVPSNGVIYLCNGTNYVWNGVDLIKIDKPDLSKMVEYQPIAFTIGQIVEDVKKVAYILQPTDAGYDPDIQKGFMMHTPANMASRNWQAAMDLTSSDNSWRLPTLAELLLIFQNKVAIGEFDLSPYWTSTSANGNEAYCVNMDTGASELHLQGSAYQSRNVFYFENYIGGVHEGDIAVYSDETGKKVKGSGIKLNELATKQDVSNRYKISVSKNGANGLVNPQIIPAEINDRIVTSINLASNCGNISVTIEGNVYDGSTLLNVILPMFTEMIINDITPKAGYNNANAIIILQ